MCLHTQFFERAQTFRKRLLNYLSRHIHPLQRRRIDAEDLLMAVIERCPDNVDEVLQLSDKRFYSWLLTATTRCLCSQHRRHLDTKRRSIRRELHDSDPESAAQVASCPANPADSPEQQAIRNEHSECLKRAMDQLPKQDRTILYLRYFESRPIEEVAPMVGLSTETCRKRDFRARTKLSRMLPKSMGT